MQKLLNKSRAEHLLEESVDWVPDLEFSRETAVGRKNMEILDSLFKPKPP